MTGATTLIRSPWPFETHLRRTLALAALWLGAGSAQAGALDFCDRPSTLTAPQQDRLLQFTAVVRHELEASGQTVALISRSGLDLHRFAIRYSHAGLSLKSSDNTPWSVRQLYYACEERRPRLFDQGLAGFLFGTDDPAVGYVSLLLMPSDAAAPVEQTALDKPRALRLLAATYSANAYPQSLRYQNCNQWVAELLATAWGDLADGADLRARAQAWLAAQAYAPPAVEVGSHWVMLAGGFIPWIHFDDHPQADVFALRMHISLPTAIEAFVSARLPAARHIELCHNERQMLIRRDGPPLAEGCNPEPGDEIRRFD
ncbi:hypothetical protein BH11PSE10_BH11PSE10_21190 [soil metagenome]